MTEVNQIGRYCSPLKMMPLSAAEYLARTGQKRGVREHNKRMRAVAKTQHAYVEHIIHAAADRIAGRIALGLPVDPLTVWNDFDPPTGITFQTAQRELPKWRELSEYMKFQTAAVCALGAEGHSFTARLNPQLENSWEVEGYDFYELIKRKIATQFRESGINEVGIAYVVEGKTKKGTRSAIHLHGFFFFDCAAQTLWSVESALETALQVGLCRVGPRRGRDIDIERMYDTGLLYGRSPGTWAAYSVKNAAKPDNRLPNRRIYMNRRTVQTAKVMWGLITDAPFGQE